MYMYIYIHTHVWLYCKRTRTVNYSGRSLLPATRNSLYICLSSPSLSFCFCTPLHNKIHPSITLQQLHLQHRFLCLEQDIPPPSPTYTPQHYLTFQSQQIQGSFYLIDDSRYSVCIVNWALGKATGSYHTNARNLQTIMQEWHPLTPFFHLLPQEDETPLHLTDHLYDHRKVHFTLSVPRTFYLRSLRIHTPDLTLEVVMAIRCY